MSNAQKLADLREAQSHVDTNAAPDGRWSRAEDVPGFERYEKMKFKRLFDTATLQQI
jgi:hypothetical protein